MWETRSIKDTSFAQRLDAVEPAFDAAICRHENFILAIALVTLAVFSLFFALRRPFWVDEYLVRQTALAGSPVAVWHLLKTAPLSVDPPLYHLLILNCFRIFGPTEFFTRFPSVLAYTFMSFLLYRFVRRYTDIYTGLSAVALSLEVGSFSFASEARPYALLLAAATAALVCWTNLVEECERRKPALLGLFVGIAVAVGSHWFGGLVLVPLLFGEAVRTWQKRRIDVGVWAALIAGGATALAYLPLLKAAAEYRTLPWKGVNLADISETFRLIMGPCLRPLALVLVVAALARLLFGTPPLKRDRSSMPLPVFICIILFALAPLFGFLFAKIVSHSVQPRYVLFSTVGLLVLVSLAIRDALGRNAIRMALAALILGGYASLLQFRVLSGLPVGGDAFTLADVSAFSTEPSLPIVPGTNDLLLRMEAHAPESLRKRCMFPTDPSWIRVLHQNTNFLMTEALRRWTQLPISDLPSFLNAHPRFYVVSPTTPQAWLLQRLSEDHTDIAIHGQYAGNLVYLVQVRH